MVSLYSDLCTDTNHPEMFTDVLQYLGVQRSGGQLRGDDPGDLQWPVLCPGDWSHTGPSFIKSLLLDLLRSGKLRVMIKEIRNNRKSFLT